MFEHIFFWIKIFRKDPNKNLVGGFKDFLFLFRTLGKWFSLASIFFKWVGSTTNQKLIEKRTWVGSVENLSFRLAILVRWHFPCLAWGIGSN